jgi:hypothetical protein
MDDDDDIPSRSGDDAYDKFGRPAAGTSRSPAGGINSRIAGGRTSVTDDAQKMRTEYEYKIATMQTQISSLQNDLTTAAQAEKLFLDSEMRVKQLEEDLFGFRQVIFPFFFYFDQIRALFSVPKNRPRQFLPYKRNWKILEAVANARFDRHRRIGRN